MSSAGALVRLKRLAEKNEGWILHLLHDRENRSTEEIISALDGIGKRMIDFGYDPSEGLDYLAGDLLLNFAFNWPIPAVPGKCPANVELSPPLEVQEFSLLMGLILNAWAKHFFLSPKTRLLGAEFLLMANEHIEFWDSTRGGSRCRNPDPKAVRLHDAIENMEKRVYGKMALSEGGARAANTRHDKPGGSRDRKQQMKDLWASGNYSTRDICAEEECAALGMSFSAARRALRNTPQPS